MTSTHFSEEQIMLTLACCSYLGFDLSPGNSKEKRLSELTSEAFSTLAPIKDRWELVWGPASYRAPATLFDDSAMFVARELRKPSRYVISIRGTNPVSLFDWIFGDFQVGRQIDWPYGNPATTVDAEISYSSALGLGILQHLRAEPLSGGARSDSVMGISKRLFKHHTDAIRSQFKQLGRKFNNKLERFDNHLKRASKLPLEAHFRRLADNWRPDELHNLFAPLDNARGMVDKRGFDLLRFIEGGSRLRNRFDRGEDLLSFLTRTVGSADSELEFIVTGHSKGGALCSTAALWLADTQGAEVWVPVDDRWDPERKARVGCYSFAGPTAGNAAFAAHSDDVIGDRCHRVTNTLDVVTNAWQVDDLRRIPTIYQPEIDPPPGMPQLAEHITAATNNLGYTQIGKHVRLLRPPLNDKKKLYPDQLAYQHLQAYINELGLNDHMSQKTFFKL